MNKKMMLAVMVVSALVSNVYANVVEGPVEPSAVQPIVTGYNSIATGVNTVVSGTSTTVMGRDNNVSGSNTTVIGANNGNIATDQSTVIGFNNQLESSDREQIIIGSNSKTNGQGATVIGTHAQALAWDSTAIGNNTLADYQNGVALGTNSVTDAPVDTASMVINGTTYNFAGAHADSVVSVGTSGRSGLSGVTEYKRQITNVAAGQINGTSTDAVNGSQLHGAITEITNVGNDLNNFKVQVGDAFTAQNEFNTAVHNTLANQKTAIKNNTNKITQHDADIKSMTNIIDNHEVRITDLEHQNKNGFTQIQTDVRRMDGRINKVGAAASALAGLHPMEFNKDDKFSASVSFGHYNNANATALGLYYRPNEKVLLGLATTFGSENMTYISASFKFGKHSEYEPQAKRDGEITAMKARIEQLERLLLQK